MINFLLRFPSFQAMSIWRNTFPKLDWWTATELISARTEGTFWVSIVFIHGDSTLTNFAENADDQVTLFKQGKRIDSSQRLVLAELPTADTDFSVSMMSANRTATMNGNQTSSCFNHEAKRIGISFYYCLIFVLTLMGNIIIGIIVYRTRSMRKPINFFIVNMAMSDLLFPIVYFPSIVAKINYGYWLLGGPVGQALCKLHNVLVYVSVFVSIQSLALIAVDRYGAVVFPLHSPLISSKRCRFLILITWIIAVAANIPDAMAFELVEYQEGLVCVLKSNEVFGESLSYRNYAVSKLVIFWYVPLVLIAILYLIVFIKLKSQNIPGEGSASGREQHSRRQKNVLKMSIAIVVTFIVCWLPTTIWWFLVLYAPDSTTTASCGFQYFAAIAFRLAHFNSAINPCISFIFSGNYRQGLKNLSRCCLVCTRANQVA